MHLKILKKGSKGIKVWVLQKRLISLGYNCGPSRADRIFGPNTERALKQFQKGHSDVKGLPLAIDGIYGPKTRWALLHPQESYLFPQPKKKYLRLRKLCIDPGHGGYDPGAVASDGTEEADLNLKVAAKFAKLAIAAGFEVILTRAANNFVTLHERCLLANQNNCSLFISFHHNSATSLSATGTEVFYWGRGYGFCSQRGQKLANLIQEELVGALQTRHRGSRLASFYVLQNTRMTAVLIEPGFISNPEEREFLKKETTQEKIAQATLAGVQRYYMLI